MSKKTESWRREIIPIDSQNRLYLSVSRSQAPYIKQETFSVVENGKTIPAWRNIEVQPDAIQMDNYDLESAGWFEKLIYQQIERKEIYLPVAGTQGFKKSSVLMLSTYSVDVNKHPCNHCTQQKMTCRLKKMPSGLYRRHFSEQGDLTTSFFISTTLVNEGTYNLLEEKAITPQEAKRLITSGEVYAELGLRRELGLPNT
jgi:hypothetical protein